MSACFADTFFFIALLSERDEAHAKAVKLAGELGGPLYTTEWVLTELADAMATPGRRERFLPLLMSLRADPIVTIIPCGAALFERGVQLYHQRPDKAWSLTDCISFLVMQDHGLTDALTGDHHFVQAGFRAALA